MSSGLHQTLRDQRLVLPDSVATNLLSGLMSSKDLLYSAASGCSFCRRPVLERTSRASSPESTLQNSVCRRNPGRKQPLLRSDQPAD